jgi:hypothetical protein
VHYSFSYIVIRKCPPEASIALALKFCEGLRERRAFLSGCRVLSCIDDYNERGVTAGEAEELEMRFRLFSYSSIPGHYTCTPKSSSILLQLLCCSDFS